jgi:spore coat protein A, manganese oxidase
MDFTGSQVYRGLAGFHIIRDDEEDALPLPKDEKDVPLMICDRSFGEDGSFMYPARDPSLQGKPGVKEHYMVFHRHNLEHEDMMMANFEVV